MKKIAIIGKGTAGCLSAVHMSKTKLEIDWYYDSSSPTQLVGEGSTLVLPQLLKKYLTEKDLHLVNGTLKKGVYKSGWATSDPFNHDFLNGAGFHFDAGLLQEYIPTKLSERVTLKDKKVEHEDIDADFIIDCSGTPKFNEDIELLDCIAVNSAYVVQCPWDLAQFDRTLTLAKKHGWVFGIPLQNRLSLGYLFDSSLSELDEIKADIEPLFTEYQVTPKTDGRLLNFNSYVRKKNFDGRVIYNGNASFFMEPIEATSTQFMYDIMLLTGRYIMDKSLTEEEVNIMYHKYVSSHKNIIMCHYLPDSRYSSKFWINAQKKAQKVFDSKSSVDSLKSTYRGSYLYSHWSKWNWDLHKEKMLIESLISTPNSK